jgi:aspartate 1-decarboxylase
MEASGIIENEKVDIYNITNGERLSTYAIKGERGSGVIGLNGAAALKVPVGSLIIIAAYGMMEQEEALQWHPTVIFPENNHLR